ncbi:sigma-70 family RNA polymerase sigma factor [Algoriphagus sp. D3-2-R+10]|uniref:RNA polymerase sigma factor n=1 Tax=Algoriphagus aurantiacus TaxID=3103948 RepID=UPI002B3AF2CB|nr:sigma-70 family RNA polymerase sigma factor [Algoriphagus sp. D3-2-R+10]MEB2776012.1 sigma-70 family RNA polymerase sigma factor [Algoriphagus sp. D3-2-R+10]
MGSKVDLIISRSPITSSSSRSDDKALWQSVRKGNDLAFSNLYQRFSNLLFNYGMHFCQNRELVKDCIQELFTSIWNRRETLSDIDSVKYYLFKSFRNLLIQHINRERKLYVDMHEGQESFDYESSIEDHLVSQDCAKENNGKIASALTKLSKRQREILVLKYFNDLSYSEIASLMSITPASAHNLLSKALQCLRVVMKASLFTSFLIYLF